MLSLIAGLLRLASFVICLIVVTSFAIFVVDQTRGASVHQQEEVNGGAAPTTSTGTRGSPRTSSAHESTLHKAIDEASSNLTSPFSQITSGSSSEWVVRGVSLLLALIIYGFGLGYLARVIRVRF